MKSISFSDVEATLTRREYVLPMVELTAQYPVRDGRKTFEYCFRKQNPSKISIPEGLLDKLSFMKDDENKLYLVLDGVYVERIVENNFKRVRLTEQYRPAETTKSGAVE